MKRKVPGKDVDFLDQRRLLTAVVDAAPVALCVIDDGGRIALAEGRSFPEIGLKPGVTDGVTFEELWAGHAPILDTVRLALAGEAAATTVVAGESAFELRFLPVTDPEGPVRHVVAVATDVTAQYSAMVNIPEREEFLQGVLDTVVDGIITIDDLGLIRDFNPAAAEIFGYKPYEVVGKTVNMLMPEAHRDEHDGYIRRYLETGEGSAIGRRREISGRRKDGEVFPIEVAISELAVGDRKHFTGVVRDITERKEAERALRASEERYALAARGANDGLWDWDLDENRLYFSSRWKRMLGHEESEIGDSPDEWLGRIHPDDVDRFRADVEAHLAGSTATFRSEYRIRRKTGEMLRMLARGVAVRRDDGTAYRMAGSQSDITERRRAEERLVHDALHDALTGLPNRTLLSERVGQALARYRRNPASGFALGALNLDRFKMVNESLGHGAGDDLLVAVSRRLENRLRPGDTLARINADSFAVLMEEVATPDEAQAIIGKMQDAVVDPFMMNGQEVYSTASVGIVLAGPEYEVVSDIIRDAEIAMSSAKREGASRSLVFHKTLHREAVGILRTETDLRHAIEHGGVDVYYQPVVSLVDGRIAGFEALARLRHPERGIIPPVEFIPVAEETGLIVPLCRQVMARACNKTVAWQKAFGMDGALTVAVNLSAKNLSDESLFAMIEQVLADTGLPSGNLKLEITESLIMANPESMTRILKRLKSLGVGLALDDFGTGYSSLSHLRRFPLDTLKIDRSFVLRLATEARDQELVRIIVLLAQTLGLDVVAEGVETTDQARLLADLRCEFAQGFLYAAPVAEDEAEALLLAEREV